MNTNKIKFLFPFILKISTFSLIAIFFWSCLSDKDAPEATPVAFVKFFHSSPAGASLDVFVDNVRINSNPFVYPNISDYLNFHPGNRVFKFKVSGTNNELIDTIFTFKHNKAYSIFIAGRGTDLKGIIALDSANAPAANKSMVRFIHLSPDTDVVDIAFRNNGTIFEDIEYQQISLFKEVSSGTFTVEAKAANGEDVYLSIPNITFQSGFFYNIILRGLTSPPDGNNNVLELKVAPI